jgi:hypothetical protein
MVNPGVADVVGRLISLVDEHYVFPEVGAEVGRVLAAGLADGRYAAGAAAGGAGVVAGAAAGGAGPTAGVGAVAAEALAAAVTADLQSVNGDKHLRLLYHVDPLPEQHGDDDADVAEMTRWAGLTCRGVARAERLPGNVGYLDLRPLLFPPMIAADAVAAAFTLLATTDVLLIDLRRCLGGEPSMVALLCTYLFGAEPVELSGLYERDGDRIKQTWTLPHVPGARFGPDKPVYVLTGATTFSGGEALAYDLQQCGRATIVGERTRGGAHPRRGFRLEAHLEVTIPIARAVSPVSGTNWEGIGVAPDIEVPADTAVVTAYRLALDHVISLGGTDGRRGTVEEAREARSADLSGTGHDVLGRRQFG